MNIREALLKSQVAEQVILLPSSSSANITAGEPYRAEGAMSQSEEELISAFVQTPRIAELVRSARGARPPQQEALNLFCSTFSGRLFEELAYFFIQKTIINSHTLILSPDEVFTLYESCLPNEVISDFPGLSKGIRGVSFPDGFIIEEASKCWTITTACEYKAGEVGKKDQWQYYQTDKINNYLGLLDKHQAELLGYYLSVIRPGIPAKPLTTFPVVDLLYVVPQDSEREVVGQRIPLPLSKVRFSLLTGSFLAKL